MTDRKIERGGVKYFSPRIAVVRIRIENGFATSSLNLDDTSIELDGFDISNPDNTFSADE